MKKSGKKFFSEKFINKMPKINDILKNQFLPKEKST